MYINLTSSHASTQACSCLAGSKELLNLLIM